MKDKYLAATDHFASGPPCNGKKYVSQILPTPIPFRRIWVTGLVCLAAREKLTKQLTESNHSPVVRSLSEHGHGFDGHFCDGSNLENCPIYWWRLRDPNGFLKSLFGQNTFLIKAWHGLFAARRSTARLSSDASRWFLPKTAGVPGHWQWWGVYILMLANISSPVANTRSFGNSTVATGHTCRVRKAMSKDKDAVSALHTCNDTIQQKMKFE